MKKIFFFFLLLFSFSALNGQVLRNTQLSLNAGGEVFDAVYIPIIKRYLIVGSFTSVNGLARNKHAFLKENGNLDSALTLGITSMAGALSTNGTLYTVALIGGNSLYIGGDIHTMNSIIRNGIIRYTISGTAINPVVNNSTTNIPNIPQGSVIFDMENTATNSICAVGYFVFILPMPNNSEYTNIFEFTNTGAISTKFGVYGGGVTPGIGLFFSNVTNPPIPQVVYHNSEYFVTCYGTYGFKYDSAGNLVHTYGRGNNAGTLGAKSKNLAILNDTAMLGDNSVGGAGLDMASFFFPTNYATLQSEFYPFVTSSGSCSPNTQSAGDGLISYNQYVFDVQKTTSTQYNVRRSNFSFIPTVNGSNGFYRTNVLLNGFNCQPINTNSANFDDNGSRHLIQAQNKLFLSSPKIAGSSILSSQGLLAYCLEPKNPSNFYPSLTYPEADINGNLTGTDLTFTPDSIVCPGQTKLYRIPPSEGATGYKWKYTGTGLKYSFSQPFLNAPLSFFNDLNDSILSNLPSANGIWIYIDNNFSPGTLSVSPYDLCNTATDYLFAKPLELNLTQLPLPNTQLADSAFFTCINDTLILSVSSSTPNVSYKWFYQNNTIINGQNYMHTGSSDPNVQSDSLGYFYVTVKNNITQCISKDSIYVTDSKEYDAVSITTLTDTFFCNTTSLSMNAVSVAGANSSPTGVNSTIFWEEVYISPTLYPNPFTVTDTISLKAYAVHNQSSCKASLPYTVPRSTSTVPGKLPSHPAYSPMIFSITDSVSCYNGNINLVCGVNTAAYGGTNGTATWIYNGALVGNSINITAADSVGMNNSTLTKTFNFQTTHGITGCIDTFDVVVSFNLEKPYVDIYLGPSTTNCSFDTVTLSHTPTVGNVSQGWLNGTTNSFQLDTLAQGAGTYVFEVINNGNGCKSYDSTTVVQNQSMVLFGTPDTLVCPNSTFTIAVDALHITDPITYLWSNGSSTNSTSGIGGIDTLLTVTGTSSLGCVGTDTISVEISAPIDATLQGFTECGSPNGSIQILTTTGGTGNYSYSIDNVLYNDSTNFANLPMDSTYTIFIKDSIGCVYDFQTVLDATAPSPSMEFLMQTYNLINDTIVAVNISAFQGFDSIWWDVPSSFTVISFNDSMLVYQALDTGDFQITMIGYQDTCVFEFHKSVRIDYFKPEFTNSTDTLGITNFSLSPNPTTGLFTVDVTFGTAQNYSIIVLTDLGQSVSGMMYSNNGASVSLPMNFPSGAAAGVYRVRVIGEYDAQQQSLVKQ